MVLAGEPERGVHRFGTAAREGDAREAAREPAIDEAFGQLDALVGGERRDELARRFERPGDHLRDFASSMTDVRDDCAARGVEDAPAVGEMQPGAFRSRDGDRVPAWQEGVALHARGIGDRSGLRAAHGAP